MLHLKQHSNPMALSAYLTLLLVSRSTHCHHLITHQALPQPSLPLRHQRYTHHNPLVRMVIQEIQSGVTWLSQCMKPCLPTSTIHGLLRAKTGPLCMPLNMMHHLGMALLGMPPWGPLTDKLQFSPAHPWPLAMALCSQALTGPQALLQGLYLSRATYWVPTGQIKCLAQMATLLALHSPTNHSHIHIRAVSTALLTSLQASDGAQCS